MTCGLATAWLLPLGAAEGGDGVALLPLLLGLLGGLALFLFGLDVLSDALKTVAGDRMRVLLARLTRNRWTGALTGAVSTAVLQSSSVVTVLVVGFVSAGLMTLTQSIGVIMGANIGTTVTAQIVAFKVTNAALVLLACGYAVRLASRNERRKAYGSVILGLGLVFLGMTVMGDAVQPLRTHQPFVEAMARLQAPALGILVGALVTALLQASAATAGIVIVLASHGLITLPAGIAVVLGANVGTCVTALLATVGKPREALRAALVHVLFNVAGVLVWVGLLGVLADLAVAVSPPGDVARQVANAHTLFNVSATALFLPLAGLFARAVKRLVPDAPEVDGGRLRAKYLDRDLVATPALALDRVRMELLHLGNCVLGMLEAILPAMLHGNRSDLAAVARGDDRVDFLHGRIITYLSQLNRQSLTPDQAAAVARLMEATNDLEAIGDVIETNLAALGRERLDQGVEISPATQRVLQDFHGEVTRALDTALMAVTQTSRAAAEVVTGMKAEINRMADAAVRHGADRLVAPEPHRVPAYRVERDMLENLNRVYYFAKRMARVVVPPDA